MRSEASTSKRASKPSWLGRFLAMLPVSCVLLYPLYLAAQLDTVEETYASPAVPEAFSGLRIVFLSDIHYGAFLGEDRVRKLVEKVNALEPDVIILGGDYGEDSTGALNFFRQLRPSFRARDAVVGVLGNHDRTPPESNLSLILEAMRDTGITPLVNDALLIRKEGKTLALCSADDVFNGFPDLEKTAAACAGADFTIFVPHNPDLLPETYQMPGGPFYQLALCGHTHGGQVAIFGHALKSASRYGSRYRSGWYREENVDILVSNGVGTSLLPVRLGARPQIHQLTLTRKNSEAHKEER